MIPHMHRSYVRFEPRAVLHARRTCRHHDHHHQHHRHHQHYHSHHHQYHQQSHHLHLHRYPHHQSTTIPIIAVHTITTAIIALNTNVPPSSPPPLPLPPIPTPPPPPPPFLSHRYCSSRLSFPCGVRRHIHAKTHHHYRKRSPLRESTSEARQEAFEPRSSSPPPAPIGPKTGRLERRESKGRGCVYWHCRVRMPCRGLLPS